jgi:ElaB/YqjD/DUF883 family membrane-anchored ribosome-binding protein
MRSMADSNQTNGGLVDEQGQPLGTAAAQARQAGARLIDEQGQAIRRTAQQASDVGEDLASMIRERPLTAALLAVGIGIVIGRLSA